jgi:uncharacterized protein YcsI (UPF0317 family)
MLLNAHSSPEAVRALARQGLWQGPTAGLANGYVQANLAILPKALADDFLKFCLANPKPCPLLAFATTPGQTTFTIGDKSLDIRSDAPRYNIFRHGVQSETVSDLTAYWRDDMLSFLIGCSFSFEEALQQGGIELRHQTEQKNVPMYNTNIALTPVGPFAGNMVVSMRPMRAADAIRAIQICSRFPTVHGAPVHLGDPALIGIADLQAPDYGDAVSIGPDELPVFWACGVTPQVAIRNAGADLAFSHSPGCMLVTDLTNASLAVL